MFIHLSSTSHFMLYFPLSLGIFFPHVHVRHTVNMHCTHTHTDTQRTEKSCLKQNVTEYPKVNLDRMLWIGAGWCKRWRGWWGAVDPINRTLWLHFRLFQFTKSARQTINVHTANVKTSLTPIKFNQGHSKCMLMLAWDQTSPIKCDLRQEGGWGGKSVAGMAEILCKQPA